MIDIKVDKKELSKALKQLEKTIHDGALQYSTDVAADVLMKKLKPRVPVSSGKLLSTLKTIRGKGKEAKTTVTIGDKKAYYVAFLEYGWHGTKGKGRGRARKFSRVIPGQNFLRKTLEEDSEAALEAGLKELENIIMK